MKNKWIFVIGLLSGLALCGLFNWGLNSSFMIVSTQSYNSLNDRVKDLESRKAYMEYELQTEKGNREYSLNRIYTRVYELDDKIDSWSDKYVTMNDVYDILRSYNFEEKYTIAETNTDSNIEQGIVYKVTIDAGTYGGSGSFNSKDEAINYLNTFK